MNKVLLDKNAGSKKLRDSCNQEGIVECFLLPVQIRDKATDSEVADFAIRHNDFILTFDRGFCCQASAVLAGRNPGLMLLRPDADSVQRISRKTASAMLKAFKEQFPEWAQVPSKNSFVELTPSLVIVHHTLNTEPVFVGKVDRKGGDWQERLKGLLEANASGSPLPGMTDPSHLTGPSN